MSNGSLLPTLTEDPQSWIDSSLLSVNQITGPGLQLLLNVTSEMRDVVRDKGGDDRLKHRLLSTVFYEGSTRTSCSFQAAMLRLGGKTIHVDGNCGNSSAAKKGESLEDTIRCLECYTDVTVLRHPVQGQVGKVIAKTRKPVLNGGDGVGEHPTQALLDVFTIYDELKLNTTPTKTLTVALLGDLKNGRTVHSLAKLLCSGAGFLWTEQLILRYCSAPGLEMPEHITNHIETTMSPNTVRQENVASLSEACRDTNILYVTRIQKERMASEGEYAKSKGSFLVDAETLRDAPSNMVVLHPLPRVDEIASEFDSDPRAAYFRQMENGMFVRMALLSLVLGKAIPTPTMI